MRVSGLCTTERIRELESSLVIASEKLEVSENEATAAGQEWQSHCKILEEEKSKLSDDLRNALAEREALDCLLESKEVSTTCSSLSHVESLKQLTLSFQREITEQLEAERDARLVAEETVRDAETDMDSVAKQSEEAINQWQGKPKRSVFPKLHFTSSLKYNIVTRSGRRTGKSARTATGSSNGRYYAVGRCM